MLSGPWLSKDIAGSGGLSGLISAETASGEDRATALQNNVVPSIQAPGGTIPFCHRRLRTTTGEAGASARVVIEMALGD
jgi:hypothetical protein